MRFLVRTARQRVAPALLTAAGVTLLAAGLLQYGAPVQAALDAGGTPSAVAVRPSSTFVPPSLPPIEGTAPPSGPPSVTPSQDLNRVATRVVIEQLGIDLPVIAQPDPSYPSCNVAMYYQASGLGQPGSGRSIYLYAHARDGMFGPLYERAILGRSGGAASLKGMLVLVYTSDDRAYEYTITQVRPRVKADSHFLDVPLSMKSETLWLQTSTGPNASYPKLQVVAKPFYQDVASHADAHPRARPVTCG